MTHQHRACSRAILQLALFCGLWAGVAAGFPGSAWGQAIRPQRVEPRRVTAPPPEVPQPPPQDSHAQSAEPQPAAMAGFYAAQKRLGRDTPIGRGVVIGQVEGTPSQYTPAIHGDQYQRVQFVTRSGPSDAFGHADAVAKLMVGQRGLAPGVTQVHNFTPQHWMTDGLLNAGTGRGPTLGDPVRVYNHSWISQMEGPQAVEVLRRVDYLIDTDGVVVCAGVNNGRDTPMPTLLAGAYNIIAVGAMNGDSSGGYTSIEGQGRCKPDVVAPGGLTSFATPVTTSVVARLVEAAGQENRKAEKQESGKLEEGSAKSQAAVSVPGVPGVPGVRPEVIKAVLMASAVKPGGWSAAKDRPLDEHLGAGMIHLDRALQTLEHGPSGQGRIRDRAGWDSGQITAARPASYAFTVYDELSDVSLLLVWHRRIDGRSVAIHLKDQNRVVAGWAHAPRLANLDLRLIEVADDGSEREHAVSASTVDNVELIHLPTLAPGRYRLEVVRQADAWDEPWRYALAWWM